MSSVEEFRFAQIKMPVLSPKEIKKRGPAGLVSSYQSIQATHAYLKRCVHYRSNTYHVAVDKQAEHGMNVGSGEIWHLSIKRHDREPIHDWRVMQHIKTAIAGQETEAVELYPAESRVVDTANQYHLYAFVNCGMIPLGFPSGSRSDAEANGSKQRAGSGAGAT